MSKPSTTKLLIQNIYWPQFSLHLISIFFSLFLALPASDFIQPALIMNDDSHVESFWEINSQNLTAIAKIQLKVNH